MRCDNHLFERRSERQQMQRLRPEQTYASVVASPPPIPIPISMDGPTPMEIERTRRQGPLSDAEKQRRRTNRLCLYCGGLGPIAVNCPHRPRRQVNQVSAHENPISSSVMTSSNLSSPNSPLHRNSFDVLSQLEDVLNE